MIACHLQMYSIIFHSLSASKASATNYYSHTPYPTCQAYIPDILRVTQWWNPSSTFSISSSTTQLSILYISTV